MTAQKPSLRDLARRLGCSHSHLSEQIRNGALQRGIAFDDRGRAMVTDIEAAAAAWRGRPEANPGWSAVIIDREGYDWTGAGLLAALEARDVLLRALLTAALVDRPTGLVEHITPLLRAQGADEETASYALRVLWLDIAAIQHPNEDDAGDP